MRKVIGKAGWGLALAVGLAVSASGQSITLTGPLNTVTVADGPEFATDTFGRGWTMDRLRDIAVETGFTQPLLTNGLWYAWNTASLAFYHVMYAGFNIPGYTMYMSHYDEGTPYGPLNPIPAATYTRLSMRSYLPAAARETLMVTWGSDLVAFPDNALFFQDNKPAIEGYRIHDIDLTGATSYAEKDIYQAPWIGLGGNAWQGQLINFLIRPTVTFPANTLHAVDWIRLYNPNTSPTLNLTWNSSGIPADGRHSVQLYVDNNASGFDGMLMHSGLINDGSFTLRTAALRPGDHYFYLRVVRMENDNLTFTPVATSGYSARLRIGHAPSATFLAPTPTSGEDYATVELLNPWDFNNASDVASVFDVYNTTYAGGVMSAVAGTSDPQVTLNTRRAGVVQPIDPRKYRYATFRMRADISGFGPHLSRVENGWVARLIWGNASSLTVSKDIPILEDWHRYTIDLWDANLPETLGSAAQTPWRQYLSITTFRLDPLEVFQFTGFDLDNITLCAENRPVNGRYTVRWSITDADSGAWTVKLFQGRSLFGGYTEHPTPLLHRTQTAAQDTYSWHVGGLANGDYRLRLEVSDGAHTRSFMSPAPVVVLGAPAPLWNAGATDRGGGWFSSPWFGGYVELGAANPNWIWHQQHGNMWVEPSSTPAGVWFWTPDRGWLWTRSEWYPYIYRWDNNRWYWYQKGSTNPRHLLDLQTGRWENW